MPPVPQPYYVQWSPTVVGGEDASWETLDRVYELKYQRRLGEKESPTGTPGRLTVSVRNSRVDGAGYTYSPTAWYRWHAIRVLAFDGFSDRVVWTGYVESVTHDFDDVPMAMRMTIRAVDALGLLGRDTIALAQADVTEGLFRGWEEDVESVIDYVDPVAAFLVGSIEKFGVANPPIMLPAKLTKNTDTYSIDASFTEKALTTLAKALDVELGHAHITADGNLAIVGRWAVPDRLSASAGFVVDVQFDQTTTGPWYMPWRRGTLEFSDPYGEYRNRAYTQSAIPSPEPDAPDVRYTSALTIPTGEPIDAIEMLDLWTIDANWLQANADLLATLYASQQSPVPAKLDVVVWDTSMENQDRVYLIHELTRVLGTGLVRVHAQVTGGDSLTWDLNTVGLDLTVTSAQVIATIYLANDAERWDAFLTANAPSYGFFQLDVVGYGLDAGMTLAP